MNFFLNQIYKNFAFSNNNTSLVIDDEEFTYNTISKYVAAIQTELKTIQTEDLVGIVTNDSILTYAAILACWFSGKGFVPLHPLHPLKRNAEIIKLASIKTVLYSSDEIANIPKQDVKCIHLKNEQSQSKLQLFNSPINGIACVLFTSGSTGIPKGVPMTFRNIDSTLDSFFALNYTLCSEDRFLQMFELTFDMSLLSYLPAFVLGASIYTVGNKKIKYLEAINIMQKYKIGFAAMVPSTLNLMKPYFSKINFPNLKYSLLGGEAFYEDLAKEWNKVIPNAKIVNISGPTEITMACMGYTVDLEFKANKTHNGILAFGSPWKNTCAITVDEQLNILNNEKLGELCFSGDHVMQGYLNQPELNNRVFFDLEINGTIHHFYRTGDMAFVDADGVFHTCGRIDKQVKIQGFKVELEEIDNIARVLQGVSNSCTLATNSKEVSEITLFIESVNINVKEVVQYLQDRLPYYMIPSKVIVVAQFPFTINGKVDRQKLHELKHK